MGIFNSVMGGGCGSVASAFADVCKALGSIPAPHRPGGVVSPVTLALRTKSLRLKITPGYRGGSRPPGLQTKANVFPILHHLPLTERVPVPFLSLSLPLVA